MDFVTGHVYIYYRIRALNDFGDVKKAIWMLLLKMKAISLMMVIAGLLIMSVL